MTGQTVRTRQEALEHAIAAAGTGTMAHFDRVASLQQLPADGLRRPLKLASNLQNFQKIFLVFND